MFREITVEELLELQCKGELTVIDVRSPSEYTESTIPGSINLPLFDDEERAQVGTIYKQESTEAAEELGLEIVSRKLPSLMRQVKQIPTQKKAVFCWRGGMRSKTVATLASLLGVRIYRLTGGFRAYRQWVVATLESFKANQLPPVYVLNGYTGTGKTLLLTRLSQLGYPVIDLEGLAGHRGSIFGHIGKRPANQKSFDAELVSELHRLKGAPYLIIEGESKRLGRVVLPDFLMEAKERGTTLFVTLPMQERVTHILEDYQPQAYHEDYYSSFKRIERRLHTPVAAIIDLALREGRFDEAVGMLLEHYYDPRYAHSMDQYEQNRIAIEAQDIDDALSKLLEALPTIIQKEV